MKKHLTSKIVVLVMLLLLARTAAAINFSLQLSYDKSNIPGHTLLQEYTEDNYYYFIYGQRTGLFGFVCGASSICPTTVYSYGTRIASGPASTETTIPENSGTAINITMSNEDHTVSKTIKLNGVFSTGGSENYWYAFSSPNLYGTNVSDMSDWPGFPIWYLRVFRDGLTSLPAGRWTGQFNFYSVDDNYAKVLIHVVGITINVTDQFSGKIYFPSFPYSPPQVSLNLNTRPGARSNTTVSGHNTLDMCLYNGGNASSIVNLIFSDERASATGRPAGEFSVYRDGADKTQPANRIDYQVSVINPTTGATQQVSNGTQITWTNTNVRNIQRQVVIPGVSGTSLCVPAPITLTTPGFTMADKASGHYTGTLRVVYTPST